VAARGLARALASASLALLVGCASEGPIARLRFVSSRATQASWSFVVDDRARGAELLVDGRERPDCNRAGREVRCELRGLWPGGHIVELRLPGAILRRTVLLGRAFPERPLLVRAHASDDAKRAAEAGADAILADAHDPLADLQEIAEAAHRAGAFFVVAGNPRAVETAGADAVLGELPPEIARNFPETRALAIDAGASAAIARNDLDGVRGARGLLEARGLGAAALALSAPAGAIVDAAAFPLLGARRRHAALRAGAPTPLPAEPGHFAVMLAKANDRALIIWNASAQPWTLKPPNNDPPDPIDLLGSTITDGELTVRPGDVAVVVRSPQPDKTRY
jgi:hypothetical protein